MADDKLQMTDAECDKALMQAFADHIAELLYKNRQLRTELQKIASYVPSAGESPASIVIYLQTLARKAINETPT